MSSSEQSSPKSEIRLQRFLAQSGLGSRRECETYITDGRVSIDGEIVTKLGTTVDPSRQEVALDGERLKIERKKYYVLNKPPGFFCTASDPQGRRTIYDLFPEEGPRLFSVGRLDENTTGLLIVTNDGDLAQKLAHPKYRIFRIYRAQVAGHPDREIFNQLKEGFHFTEGKFKVHDIRPVKKQRDSTWVEITMTEGRNREIRRLLARANHKVMKLERIAFGPVRLGKVSLGEYRELRKSELAQLHEIIEKTRPGGSSSGRGKKLSSKKPAGKQSTGKKTAGNESSGRKAPGKTSSGGTKGSTKKKPPQRTVRSRKKRR